ncbi:hypothetical protein [Spirosoma linguale]|uniref:Uncharacterized protein n=1 Tax=Spirosoma linguale (strain ATCC 33905 / DSM 74 / LMG 10896 / Claus 1) TaxID=504472 RepID=D2QCE1_SPILD|nr:hypothetical protein Slin_0187 [Spirosoma linguale DSM 74]
MGALIVYISPKQYANIICQRQQCPTGKRLSIGYCYVHFFKKGIAYYKSSGFSTYTLYPFLNQVL